MSNIIGVLSGNEHIRLADCVGLRVQFLPQQPNIGIRINLFTKVFLTECQHAARPATRVKDTADNSLPVQIFTVFCKQQTRPITAPHPAACSVPHWFRWTSPRIGGAAPQRPVPSCGCPLYLGADRLR